VTFNSPVKTRFILTNIEGNLLGDLIDYEAFLGLDISERKKLPKGEKL
jgi:hypothetical protein